MAPGRPGTPTVPLRRPGPGVSLLALPLLALSGAALWASAPALTTPPATKPRRIVSLKPFTLVNLNAQYKLSERFSVFGRVENLFDVKYEEVFSFATPGAAAYGGVRVAF